MHRAYSTQGQEAFLEGHQQAFEVLGGTPIDKIRYDNLKSAVSRVLFGRNRTESARWVAFRSHHGFDAFYCNPGVEGAHEKGGVEGEGGRFRRNHLVPVPVVATMAELNDDWSATTGPMTTGGSGTARSASASTSPSRPTCSARCRPRCSRPG